MQIGSKYANIYASYELSRIEYVIRSTGICKLHGIDICPEQIYLTHCTYMINWTTAKSVHIDPTLMHTKLKMKKMQVLFRYVLATNKPLICHLYVTWVNYSMYCYVRQCSTSSDSLLNQLVRGLVHMYIIMWYVLLGLGVNYCICTQLLIFRFSFLCNI